MYREFLRTDGGRAGKQDSFFLTNGVLEHVPHQFVVDVRIMVMHFLRIGTVKPLNISWDTFAKVGLKAINAHRDQTFQFVGVPFAGIRIGKVINRQTWLPFIPLP